jgi:hypothetical protein
MQTILESTRENQDNKGAESSSDEEQYAGVIEVEKTKTRKKRVIHWQSLGVFRVNAKTYLARLMNKSQIWIPTYSKPQFSYTVYKCYDKLCTAQLKLLEIIARAGMDANVMKSMIFRSDDDCIQSCIYVEVFTFGQHRAHDPEEIKEMMRKLEKYG